MHSQDRERDEPGDASLPRLVGRAAEQRALADALERAVAGTAELVIVEGEPGIGKSALARHLVALADASTDRPISVLAASGEISERRIDLGIIEQLYVEAVALGLAGEIPFGRADTRPDPLDVGARLVDLLTDAAAAGPVLVVVDDAQWTDQASVQALTFALRRASRLPLLTAIVQRPGVPELEPLHRLARDRDGRWLHLAALDPGDLRELIGLRTGQQLSLRAAERLHAHTGGSPLEAVTLAQELGPAVLTPGLGALPAPRSYATVVLNRMATCSPATEQLVAALAVLGMPTPLGTIVRMLDGDDLAGAVDDALEHALVSTATRGGVTVLDVDHPMLRAAVLQDLEPGRRAELHRRAAAVTTDPGRAMLHRLHGVWGQDADLAAEAVAMARVRLAEGWELLAVELLSVAAEVFGPGPERSAALVLTADRLLAVGDKDTAREVLDTVEAGAAGAFEDLVRGQLAFLDGDPGAARSLLRQAWDDAGEDHSTAARAAGLLATTLANAGQTDRTLTWARRALEQGDGAPLDVGHAVSMIASAWALKGDVGSGLAEVEERIARSGRAAGLGHDGMLARGLLALWSGDLVTAEEQFESILALPPESVDQLTRTTARYSLADCWYRTGDWTRAIELSEQLATTLDDADRRLGSPMAHGVAAFVAAGRGEQQRATEHIRAGQAALARAGNPAGGLWLTVAAAKVAHASGDAAGVVGTLEPLAALLDQVGLPEAVQPWRADLVDALTQLGRLDDAADALGTLEAKLGSGDHAVAGAHRASGILAAARGDDGAATAAFDSGLALDPVATGAFHRARLELAAGAFHRRRGRRRIAADLLGTALHRFDALGSVLAEQARQELDACGLTPNHDPDPGAAGITPAEAKVAELVARGLTNREVANELVVSIKTVESHLARVFAKLGVRSRTEMALRWTDEPPPTAEP